MQSFRAIGTRASGANRETSSGAHGIRHKPYAATEFVSRGPRVRFAGRSGADQRGEGVDETGAVHTHG